MIAACYMLEKLKVDREVDVFHAVKQVRIPRPEFVTSLVSLQNKPVDNTPIHVYGCKVYSLMQIYL